LPVLNLATTLVVMSTPGEKDEDELRVKQSQFLSDATAVLRRAERAPVIVTDERGAPRMAIHCPREPLPFDVD